VNLVAFTEPQLHEVLDVDGLRRWLRGVERGVAPYPQPGRSAGTDDAVFADLVPTIRVFLDEPQWLSLTVSARFGHGGVTVSRLEPGPVQFQTYFPNRFEPDVEADVRSLMTAAGIECFGHHDINGGLSRALFYLAPESAEAIATTPRLPVSGRIRPTRLS
jgi:hypothetical protein